MYHGFFRSLLSGRTWLPWLISQWYYLQLQGFLHKDMFLFTMHLDDNSQQHVLLPKLIFQRGKDMFFTTKEYEYITTIWSNFTNVIQNSPIQWIDSFVNIGVSFYPSLCLWKRRQNLWPIQWSHQGRLHFYFSLKLFEFLNNLQHKVGVSAN